MTITCCYCVETNNSRALWEDPDTIYCTNCRHCMHTRCYIVAHTRRTLVCNPVDKPTIRCATHDTALTAHDSVQAVRLRYLLEQRAEFVASEVAAAANQLGKDSPVFRSNSK